MGQFSLPHLLILIFFVAIPFYFLRRLTRGPKTHSNIDSSDNIDKIEKLFELKAKGAISEDEYKAQKALLLKK